MRTTRPTRPQTATASPSINIPAELTCEQLLVLIAVHNISMRNHGHNAGEVHTSQIVDECQQSFSFLAFDALTSLRERFKLLKFSPKTPMDDIQWIAPDLAANIELILPMLEEKRGQDGKPMPLVIGITDDEGDDDADEGEKPDPAPAPAPAPARRSGRPKPQAAPNP